MQRPLNPRRIKVIDNVLQYRVIAILLVVVLAGLVVLVIGALAVSAAINGWSTPALSWMYTVLPAILVGDVVIMLFLIVAGIFLTHRIAGPVYRMEKDIERVLAGERGVRVKLRKRDSFHDLAEKVNKLIAKLDARPQG